MLHFLFILVFIVILYYMIGVIVFGYKLRSDEKTDPGFLTRMNNHEFWDYSFDIIEGWGPRLWKKLRN